MAKSKLPSPGVGGAQMTDFMKTIGRAIKNTVVGIHGTVTGGYREQTYGWTSEFFPGSPYKENKTKKSSGTATPVNSNLGNINIPEGPGADNAQILELLKDNYADEKRYREVQQSFAEERANEDNERHEELVKALKDFTGTKTATPVVGEKKEGGGFLDTLLGMFKSLEEKIKGMVEGIVNKVLDGIDLFKKADLLGKLMMFLRSPIFGLLSGPLLMVGAILGLAYLFRKAVELVPDYSKLTPEEAKNVLENGSERDIAALGGRDKLMEVAMGGKEAAQRALDTTPELTDEERTRLERIAGLTVTPQTATELPPAPPRPDETKGLAGRNKAAKWDMLYGETHNPDGSPKVRTTAKRLPSGVEESTAGAGRGTAQLTDYKARQLESEGGKAAIGVKPQGIKAAPVPPPASPVSALTDMNRDLEMHTTPTGDVSRPIIQKNNSGLNKNEPPLPATATPRDEEPMAAFVYRTQRRNARAY